MVRELSLIKEENDQFTFIRTIKVKPDHRDSHQDCTSNLSPETSEKDGKTNQSRLTNFTGDSDSKQQVSHQYLAKPDISDRQKQNSSAIQPIKQQQLSSHLSVNNQIAISDLWFQKNLSTTPLHLFVPDLEIPDLKTNSHINKSTPQSKFQNILDKLLVVAALGYCGFLGWSLFGSPSSNFSLALLQKNPPNLSQADLDFLVYFEESLGVIDSNLKQQQSSTNHHTHHNQNDLVYLPVYTPTPPAPSNDNLELQPSSLLPPPPPANNFAALNPPVAKIPIKQQTPPSLATSSDNIQAPTNPTNLSIASPKSPSLNSHSHQQQKAQKFSSSQSQVQPTLIGIIELKTNSAALFNLKGNTEKIWLGDNVGNTGWKLVEIRNQKAKIAYQGKNLTLGIGQSFQPTP